MPIPAMLAALINRLGKDFNPDAKRTEYNANISLWRSYLDLLELDETKLPDLIEPHEQETPEKLAIRRKLAAIFNYVPSIIRMTANYLHSEQPTYEVADERLAAFIANCNGSGLSLAEYVRREALPLALTLGWVDTLLQNPATADNAFMTRADEQSADNTLLPRVFTVTPLQRINWSARSDDSYNWLRFTDKQSENPLPFVDDPTPKTESYITISAFATLGGTDAEGLLSDDGKPVGFWVRSFKDPESKSQKGWSHDGDWLSTRRCPVATLYYQKSIDPDRRHWGLSKIAMIAILTKKIAQLLSWSDEDVLSNLAVFVMPGDPPVDPTTQKPAKVVIHPWSVLWIRDGATIEPKVIQGDVAHIRIKWEIINFYIQEILRLAYLIGVSAEAEQITSGIQGVVARTELFQELRDLAGACDRFGLEVLALAASLLNDEDISVDQLNERFNPTVDYYKGNYAVDPLKTLIENSQALIDTFRDISPTMVEELYRQLAQASLYNEQNQRETVMQEIAANFQRVNAERQQMQQTLNAGIVAAANNAGNQPNPRGNEILPGNPNDPAAPTDGTA